MSSSHKFYQDWSPDFFLKWAKKSGDHVEAYVAKLLQKDSYPEVAYKQCLGVINLKSTYTDQRLDKACELALEQSRYGYHIIKNILVNKTDMDDADSSSTPHIGSHSNLRGASSYN